MSLLSKILISFTILLSACGSIKDSPKYQLSDGKYSFRQAKEKYTDAYVYVEEDSIRIYLMSNMNKPLVPQSLQSQYFLKRSF